MLKHKAAIFICIMMFYFLVAPVYAGDLNPPAGGPDDNASVMYTIDDIYNMVLDRDTQLNKTLDKTSFLEPDDTAFNDDAPTKTSVTLDDVYELVRHYAPPAKATGNPTKAGNIDIITGQDDPTSLICEMGGIPYPIPRFTINIYGCDDLDEDCEENDDTVTDNMTGLEWTRSANLGLESIQNAYVTGLVSDCAVGGGNEGKPNNMRWRIPTSLEFVSLFDYAYYYPSIPNTEGTAQYEEGNPFIGIMLDNHYTGKVADAQYWAIERNEISASNRQEAFMVRPADGTTDGDDNYYGSIYEYDKRYFWLVRGGQEGDWENEWLMTTPEEELLANAQ